MSFVYHVVPLMTADTPAFSFNFPPNRRYDQYQYGQNEEDGGRRLANQQVQYVNCDTCASMGCFQQNQDNGGNDENQVTLEGMVEWVQEMSECQDTEVQYNNMDLRAGFMCNEDGTGVELAIFLDEECSVYNSQQSYSNLINSAYAQNSQSVVTYPFVNDIDCAQDVEWASPEEMYNNDGNDDNNQDDNGEEPEVNEYCQQLLQGEMLTPLDYCAYGNDGNNNNNNNNNQDNENQNQYFYGYDYDLTQEESEEAYAVCTALNKMQSEGSSDSWKKNAAKKSVYKGENSGRFYDYSARTGSNASSTGASGGMIAVVLLAVAAVCGLAFFGWKHYSKKQDDRKEPLVSEGLA